MYHFHATIHARPDQAVAGPAVAIAGRTATTLQVPPLSKRSRRLCRSAADVLRPDGSFVGFRRDQPAWQVDGNLYDRLAVVRRS
jgi:hypothetical protein